MLVIFLGEFFVLLFEDAVVPLEEILLHHCSLQLVSEDSHLRSVALVLSDEVFDLLFIDAVKLIGFELKDAFPKLAVLFL